MDEVIKPHLAILGSRHVGVGSQDREGSVDPFSGIDMNKGQLICMQG